MLGRSVYVGQNVKECGIDARIRMIADAGTEVTSGVVTKDTHLNFRSRSARLVWLVQISSEMWDYDLSGQLYFDLFINQFVDVLMEQWKAVGVLHSLSIVFFARTLYLDEVRHIEAVTTMRTKPHSSSWHGLSAGRSDREREAFEPFHSLVPGRNTH
jgi:hypothetical protein